MERGRERGRWTEGKMRGQHRPEVCFPRHQHSIRDSCDCLDFGVATNAFRVPVLILPTFPIPLRNASCQGCVPVLCVDNVVVVVVVDGDDTAVASVAAVLLLSIIIIVVIVRNEGRCHRRRKGKIQPHQQQSAPQPLSRVWTGFFCVQTVRTLQWQVQDSSTGANDREMIRSCPPPPPSLPLPTTTIGHHWQCRRSFRKTKHYTHKHTTVSPIRLHTVQLQCSLSAYHLESIVLFFSFLWLSLRSG